MRPVGRVSCSVHYYIHYSFPDSSRVKGILPMTSQWDVPWYRLESLDVPERVVPESYRPQMFSNIETRGLEVRPGGKVHSPLGGRRRHVWVPSRRIIDWNEEGRHARDLVSNYSVRNVSLTQV